VGKKTVGVELQRKKGLAYMFSLSLFIKKIERENIQNPLLGANP